MSVSSPAPRRSSRLMDLAMPPAPPPKKQCLGKSRTSKSVNQAMLRRSSRLMDVSKPPPPPPKKPSPTSKSVKQGHHDSDPQFGTQSPDNSSIDNIPLELLYALDSDYWDSDSDSGPERHSDYSDDDCDIFFGRWDTKDRKVHIVILKHSCQNESRCINILKEIGCEAYFLRLSKTYRRRFYARLTKDDVAKLKCIEGVVSVDDVADVLIVD